MLRAGPGVSPGASTGMKQLSAFNGAVTAVLLSLNLNSSKVLTAVNSWVGQQNAGEGKDDKVTVEAGAKLSGKVTEKNGDKRVITIKETEKRVAKRSWTWQGGLYALSTACDEMIDRHGVVLAISELPREIEVQVCRDTFRDKPEPAPAPQNA